MDQKDFSAATARLAQAAEQVGKRGPAVDAGAHLRSVQAQIDAIARGDLEGVLAHAHGDVTLEIYAPPEFPWIRRASGMDELRTALEHNFGSLVDQRPTISDVFADGNVVVLFGRERGRVKATGQPYDVEFVERFTFRQGRLAAVRIVAAHTVSATVGD